MRHNAPTVAEHDPLDLHLSEPLPAAATRRGVDRRDDEVAGTVSLGHRPREGGSLGADTERVRGILDVDALDDAPVAGEHRAADVEPRIRRVRACGDRVSGREELFVGHAANIWKIPRVTSAPSSPPTATSEVEWIPASTRVWATSPARMNASDETRN